MGPWSMSSIPQYRSHTVLFFLLGWSKGQSMPSPPYMQPVPSAIWQCTQTLPRLTGPYPLSNPLGGREVVLQLLSTRIMAATQTHINIHRKQCLNMSQAISREPYSLFVSSDQARTCSPLMSTLNLTWGDKRWVNMLNNLYHTSDVLPCSWIFTFWKLKIHIIYDGVWGAT